MSDQPTPGVDDSASRSRPIGLRRPGDVRELQLRLVHPELSNQLGVWRNLWSDGDDLARHARVFIAERLHRR